MARRALDALSEDLNLVPSTPVRHPTIACDSSCEGFHLFLVSVGEGLRNVYQVNVGTDTHTHTHICIYIYMYIYSKQMR